MFLESAKKRGVNRKVTFIAPGHVSKVSDEACQSDRVNNMYQVCLNLFLLLFVGIQTSARSARIAQLNRVEHTSAEVCVRSVLSL